jgi:nucleoside transporter
MKLSIRIKLSVMMFLEYFVWGTWYVTLSTYLATTLKFSGPQIGLAYGATAIAAIISPVFIGKIADRYFASQRVLGILHLLGAALLFFLSTLQDFGWFYPVIILYAITYMPTIALTNSIAFQKMADPGKEFPAVRVLGTIGWIAAGLVIGYLKIEATHIPLQFGAISSLVLGVYSFFLPHVEPKKSQAKSSFLEIMGFDALSMLKSRSFAILVFSAMLVCIPLSFYYSFTNLYLNDIGIVNAAGKMTLGQVSEILFMLIMPFFFVRLGVKWMILISIVAWGLRFVFFAMGTDPMVMWMIYGGIILHGICYDFFFVTGQIYVDKKAPAHFKSSAQGLITLATYGLGMLIGTWLSGVVVEIFSVNGTDGIIYNWKMIWLVPAAASVLVLIFFGLFFRDTVQKPAEEEINFAAEESKMAIPE